MLRNRWYIAAWTDELVNRPIIARTILGERIVLFRDLLGIAAAVADRCPHRFAPLSLGNVVDGGLQCAYHGLVFGGDGRCIRNPHGEGMLPPRAQVQSYPIQERYQGVWIWMGETAAARPELIPDLSFIDRAAPTARYNGYLPTAANYQLLTDNILDLSHIDFLHPGTLSTGGSVTGSVPKVKVEGEQVRVEWAWEGETLGIFQPLFPKGALLRTSIAVTWHAPAIMVLTTSARMLVDPSQAVTMRAAHAMTPETDTRTHYMFYGSRDFHIHDADFNAFARERIMFAFGQQDKPMIEAVQASMGTTDLWSLAPTILSSDRAAVRARRILEKLLREEAVAAQA